ncbi:MULTISPECIES: M48 metallopeptidase family protein [Thermobifida]|uniref:M48 metallopeptidase family protein n=1 Tax=Thermobifida TaxID=83677 RepID=UPI001D0C34AC|nr:MULTISPECIES: M48 family metallopeptidase [Thermobifida]MDD6793043.1 M48 family metallopeptidase [Thermobifida fusca]
MRRSSRRRRIVSAYRSGNRTVVLLPTGLSHTEEQKWVDLILQRLRSREAYRHPSNLALHTRAVELAERYLDGKVRPSSVRWADDPRIRWGACKPAEKTIRIAHRLAGMPGWVLDYVLMHELVHLIVPGHGPEFWRLVNRYPHSERARGYLEGFTDAPRLLTAEHSHTTEPDEHPAHD